MLDGYSLAGYGAMIADRSRIEAYASALRRVVGSGSVVTDLGCGTGIISLLACRFGARRVFAIEPADAIQVAREAARANGFADQIEFFQDHSTRISLPEKADVVVSDLRGVLPPFQQHIPAIVDARARHLKPAGKLIPQRDTLWAAVVEAPEPYAKLAEPWSVGPYDLDLSAGLHLVLNTWTKSRLRPEQLLTKPQSWATLDYHRIESPTVEGACECPVIRSGTAHGILVWFDAVLLDGIQFSNSPYVPEMIYGAAFFPWLDAVPVAPGDTASLTLHANLVGDDYVWRWNSRLTASDGACKARFEQSTFFGTPLVPAALRKRASNFVAARSADAEIAAAVLALMDGSLTVADIAARIQQQFPGRFASQREALAHVGDLCVKYSR
jgi:protein arginine N-methyltransferase 1